MNILAIESSCDETACAVVKDGVQILSNVVASSHEMHEKYGGIVPEVAARMQLSYILPVITEALALHKNTKNSLLQIINEHIDAIAVAIGPGLIGCLLVGVETAKTIAMVANKPIIPVNHVLAHMYANFVDTSHVIPAPEPESNKNNQWIPDQVRDDKKIQFPAISLVVSGGHTELYLMQSPKELTWLGGTLDDAAGECFDKTARLLGFGHGGGVAIQEAASQSGTDYPIRLSRPMLDKENRLNFSFSGLKTAIMREVNSLKATDALHDMSIRQLSREVQETITDVLVKKTLIAADTHNVASILLSGGVASNIRLREKFTTHAGSRYAVHYPPVELCTDNAVYIASYAHFRGEPEDWRRITAHPDLSVEVLS